MLPSDEKYGPWARSGEIDIVEAVNLSPENNRVYSTLHYGAAWPNNKQSGTYLDLLTTAWERFDDYAIEWEEGEIRWFVDNLHCATQQVWFSEGTHIVALGGTFVIALRGVRHHVSTKLRIQEHVAEQWQDASSVPRKPPAIGVQTR